MLRQPMVPGMKESPKETLRAVLALLREFCPAVWKELALLRGEVERLSHESEQTKEE